MTSTRRMGGIFEGQLSDGCAFRIAVPDNWKGWLVSEFDLFDDPADVVVEQWILEQGHALARHSREGRRWHLERGLGNHEELLARFAERFGSPEQTLVWGCSQGGLLTRLAIERDPGRYCGAIPMDGGGAGSLAVFSMGFHDAFVLSALLDPQAPLTELHDDPVAAAGRLIGVINARLPDPAVRARLALAAGITMRPVWTDRSLPEPEEADLDACLDSQVRGLLDDLGQSAGHRVTLERHAGAAFVGNDGIDYGALLSRSGAWERVQLAYDLSGLSLQEDLATLETATRLVANAGARDAVSRGAEPRGHVSCPVLTMKSLGDPNAVPPEEHSYRELLRRTGNVDLLRQAWVHNAGHVNFTAGELAAAVDVLIERVEQDRWTGQTQPRRLNERAAVLAQRTKLDLTVLRRGAPAAAASRFTAYAPGPHVLYDATWA